MKPKCIHAISEASLSSVPQGAVKTCQPKCHSSIPGKAKGMEALSPHRASKRPAWTTGELLASSPKRGWLLRGPSPVCTPGPLPGETCEEATPQQTPLSPLWQQQLCSGALPNSGRAGAAQGVCSGASPTRLERRDLWRPPWPVPARWDARGPASLPARGGAWRGLETTGWRG